MSLEQLWSNNCAPFSWRLGGLSEARKRGLEVFGDHQKKKRRKNPEKNSSFFLPPPPPKKKQNLKKNRYNADGAFAASVLLCLMALGTLYVKDKLERKAVE